MVFFVVDIISRYQVIHWLPILLLSDHVTKLFITISLQFIENSISPGHNLVFHRNPLHRYSQTNFLNFKTAAALLYFHFKHKKPPDRNTACAYRQHVTPISINYFCTTPYISTIQQHFFSYPMISSTIVNSIKFTHKGYAPAIMR